jgi:hypothetical protein
MEENGITRVIWGAPSFWIERFPLFFGREMGLFQARGVYPEVRIFHGGPELMKAVQDEKVHVGQNRCGLSNRAHVESG